MKRNIMTIVNIGIILCFYIVFSFIVNASYTNNIYSEICLLEIKNLNTDKMKDLDEIYSYKKEKFRECINKIPNKELNSESKQKIIDRFYQSHKKDEYKVLGY